MIAEVDEKTLPMILYKKCDKVFDFSIFHVIGQYFISGHKQLALVHGGYGGDTNETVRNK
ncbi:hypothetical protein Ga0466249_002373 [Sporomusaceae bacterium BoRhaA]|nr:hypothetical protein [Pelorhabdus rhamnosifermentans]